MLLLITFTLVITIIEASSVNQERMLYLMNQRQRRIPKDLLGRVSPFLYRSDAQIWFESFKDTKERMMLFNATTWYQLYDECQGLHHQIAQRLNYNGFAIEFDESFRKILKVLNMNKYRRVSLDQYPFNSLDLNDLNQLQSLTHLGLGNVLSGNQTVPDLNEWSDHLEYIDLSGNGLISSVSFTGFPKRLWGINLSNNNLNGDIYLPPVISNDVEIIVYNNPSIKSIKHVYNGYGDYKVETVKFGGGQLNYFKLKKF